MRGTELLKRPQFPRSWVGGLEWPDLGPGGCLLEGPEREDLPQRWSTVRKMEIILRLLRGEDLDR